MPPSIRGLALIELIATILVMGLMFTGTLLAINQVLGHSADAIVHRRALAIAESYLEREMLKPYGSIGNISGQVPENVQNNQPLEHLASYRVEVKVEERFDFTYNVRGKWIMVYVSGSGLDTPLVLSTIIRSPQQ